MSAAGANPQEADGIFLAPPPEHPVEPGPVPTFSVLIAAYQVADFVGEAVASALAQTVPPVEVVVCDDGSTDDIEGALRPYRDRIKLIRQENRGEAAAKNAAARAATGEFVSFLDADDLYLPGRNEMLGQFAAARPDLDMLTTNCLIEVNGEVVAEGAQNWRFVADDQRTELLRGNFIFGNLAVRRSRFLEVGGFDESVVRVADWDVWLRLVFSGSRIGYVTRPLARYRVRRESLSNDRLQMGPVRVELLERVARTYDLSPEERIVLDQSLDVIRRNMRLESAKAMLMEGAPEARRSSLAVARDPGYGLGTRAKTAFCALFPRAGRRMLVARESRSWLVPGGVRAPR